MNILHLPLRAFYPLTPLQPRRSPRANDRAVLSARRRGAFAWMPPRLWQRHSALLLARLALQRSAE